MANSRVIFDECNWSAVAVKGSDWRPKFFFLKGSEQTLSWNVDFVAHTNTQKVKTVNPLKSCKWKGRIQRV